MNISHRITLSAVPAATLVGLALAAAPAQAAAIDLTVTIPRLTVAEYHRPYVAIWLEQKGGAGVKNLAIWYDYDMKNNEGTKWLRDIRMWWRKTGRTLKLPADGITGATRAPGPQKISFSAAQIGTLAPGQYDLVIEAAREVGGREVVRLPIQWPPAGNESLKADGASELGAVTAIVKR